MKQFAMFARSFAATFVLFLLTLGLSAPSLFAQASGTIKGVCKDVQGNPIADGVVQLVNVDNGQKYTLKTNKKGEYFSLGIATGKYKITLYQNADDLKANKELFHIAGYQIQLDENVLDFDLKKEQERTAQGEGLTPDQLKQQQEAKEKQAKEASTVKTLNGKIAAANAATKAGDFDGAVSILTEAVHIDATRDVIWGQLADAYRASASKQTEPAEKSKRLQEAVNDYLKAIDIRQKTMGGSTTGTSEWAAEALPPAAKKDSDESKGLAAYYNNLGEAYGKAGKADDALKAYTRAAQLNPENTAAYYYNAGAVLTNAGKLDDAIAAFDKCLAADPNRADAYYQKGVDLMGKATLQGDKMVAPPGTAEAFQKYLELQPAGQFADIAKQMLASIGSPIETDFGKKKPSKKSN